MWVIAKPITALYFLPQNLAVHSPRTVGLPQWGYSIPRSLQNKFDA